MRIVIAATMLALLSPGLRAADSDSIESAVHAVYDVISGPAGTRDWARFKALFADGARLIPVRATPEGGVPAVLTTDGYIGRAGANFSRNGFYESEVSSRIERFGNIAHVFTTYESRHAPAEKPFARGINSMQLIHTAAGWKVISIAWDSEREGNPIPDKYLK